MKKRYKVTERRAATVEYIVEADSQADAENLNGEILEESETDNWAVEMMGCEEVDY
jgi:Fe2+ or Zn2+ uptake regulation protein